MREKDLKRLSRAELLELLLVQTRETERLREKLEIAEAQLSERQLKIEKAGDLAHAVLEINGVAEAIQAASQQYLDNIIRMERETELRCEQMLSAARKEVAEIRSGVQHTDDVDDARMEEIQHLLDEIK